MERKNINKIFIFLLSFVLGGFMLTSCSDWTENENLDIVQPEHAEYEKYLENLRKYKNSDHKYVYAWFDNKEKTPSSRGQHMSDIPDSIDVVVLMYPEALAEFELEDMNLLQTKKATKVMYTISYDAIQKNYDEMIKEAEEGTEIPEFSAYLKSNVENLLALSANYNYDGLIVGFNGQSTAYMTAKEKAEYLANQESFISQITTWYQGNKSKSLVFEGGPQFLEDKSFLESCKHIILNTMDASMASELSVNLLEASASGVPADRFIVKASATSLDTSDKNIGYYGEDRAIIEAAYWVTESEGGYTKAGLGIYNIQNDYYNATEVYQYAKQSINIMNPAPIK